MGREESAQKDEKFLMDKGRAEQSPESDELTLPEKLCRFYIQRPKLAFGMLNYNNFLKLARTYSVIICK